ncbi:cation:proton antiporter [Kitasatospora sp. NPDC057940]|uniref:cation:proton antiporter n=1 Tax=Kitasatospora sp. NPDC057940 TaxID=3346285 RepID=UPI0036D9498F
MTPRHVIEFVLLWSGVGCLLLSATAVVRFRATLMRLHALAPASVAGVPLIAAAVALDQGLGRGAAKTLFIGLVFAIGGTVTTIAVGRAARQAEDENGSRA